MERYVELDPNNVIAQGTGRQVFTHPDRPDALIKVFKPRRNKSKFVWLRPIKRRFSYLKTAYKEYEEYISALSRLRHLPIYLPAFWGFVDTNLGIGMMVEKITGANGEIAPTQHNYILRYGLSDELIAETHALIDELEAARIVAYDLTPRNIVVGENTVGKRQLVLVDGISENTLFRAKTHFPFIYRRWIAKKRAELIVEMHRIDDLRKSVRT